LRDGTLCPASDWMGSDSRTRWLLLGRALCGFGGLSFGLLTVQLIPIGDATVLIMTSPTFATLAAFLLLKEDFGRNEAISTVLSLVGACLVVKPTFLFGGEGGSATGTHFVLPVFVVVV
jgi:drug/metabolite transporter (DMT)-like permease